MGFFKGQETYSVDAKGRVNVPAKMRKALEPDAEDTFIVTRGMDSCLVAYPKNEWKKYEEQFATLNQYEKRNRFFLRTILRWSEEVSLDSQQRVALPKKLLEFAGIEGKVTIVGMMDRIEFWRPEKFEDYLERLDDLDSAEEPFEDVASMLMNISSQ